MQLPKLADRKKTFVLTAIFLIINIPGILFIGVYQSKAVDERLISEAENTSTQFDSVLENYKHSFEIFTEMMSREIENNPDPEDIWDYLKSIDSKLLDIEGETFDGLYMYYKGRYLYSWNTPYSEYEKTGYDATTRPWYKDAVAGKGRIVFTPPYMSYANDYILTTISQLQPDGETVFAYDLKMGDIQSLISSMNHYDDEQVMVFDQKGTIIGSTNADYLGSNFEDSLGKAKDFGGNMGGLATSTKEASVVTIDGAKYYGYLLQGGEYSFLVLVPLFSMLKGSVDTWLVPLLFLELFLIYVFGRISKGLKNRELRQAYVELGQTQRRLEVALQVAQKEAAIDVLTGMMNFNSFRKHLTEALCQMAPEETGIFIMIDGDHFKQINDNYGHNVGDEVIKLTAQMIVGRIRTIDIASRLHGDEFAIFVSDSSDFSVARKIMEDINHTLAKEAEKRNMPSITLSSGAVLAKHGDSYMELSKAADIALYKAKATHNGGFAHD